jgi:hypothetical protein
MTTGIMARDPAAEAPGLSALRDAVKARLRKLRSRARHARPCALTAARLVPALGGATLVSLGGGEVIGHVFGHGLAPWAGLLAGGLFLLRADARMP